LGEGCSISKTRGGGPKISFDASVRVIASQISEGDSEQTGLFSTEKKKKKCEGKR